jgi:hypothetical protein
VHDPDVLPMTAQESRADVVYLSPDGKFLSALDDLLADEATLNGSEFVRPSVLTTGDMTYTTFLRRNAAYKTGVRKWSTKMFEKAGCPDEGWPVTVQDDEGKSSASCPCTVWSKDGACVHSVMALSLYQVCHIRDILRNPVRL